MESKNKLRQTVVLVLVIVVVLVLLSISDSSFVLGNYKFKRIDILSDIKTRGVYQRVPLSSKLLTDSVIRSDSIVRANFKQDQLAIYDFGNDSLPALSNFFESLFQTAHKKKKTRIAYFGDSMIEGDLITQDLRTSLQDTFGGIGVGFMPITSIVAGFRQTVLHTFSDNWQTYSLINHPEAKHTLGITGFDFIPAAGEQNSWVKYSAVSKKHLNRFCNVKLFFGANFGIKNYVTALGKIFPLAGTAPVNEIQLAKDCSVQSLNVDFQCESQVNIFGFSIEGDSGVYVDNFSFRGNSGLPLVKIPVDVLSGINEKLDYGLVILHYGVNVVNAKVTDFSWYERGMRDVVNHIKTAMPNASILIISTGDKSIKQGDNYVTDPSVPLVIDVQKKVAQETSVAFWNLYESMGGYNSMVKWVQGDTVLANRDYTHPNLRGAKKIATMLNQHLLDAYREYVSYEKN
ncbi:MAG: hypothetical protein IT235_02010 [Bacteroidia bacterium]|nr:hypothetical protein [Bacteroidia bacterium]